MSEAADNIPEQYKGKQTDVIHFVDYEDQAKAHQLFQLAKDVSNCHTISGPGSSKFSITDTREMKIINSLKKVIISI